ncbi:MAG: SAM-dependent methyltransferase, partial [Microcystaceae cyanobacterium]
LFGNAPELMERAQALSERDRYRLIEVLDPEITHYEFFLAKPPFLLQDWTEDQTLLAAQPEPHPCLTGWPSQSLFDYDYQPVELTETEFAFLQGCDQNPGVTVGQLQQSLGISLDIVRSLHQRQLILLTP